MNVPMYVCMCVSAMPFRQTHFAAAYGTILTSLSFCCRPRRGSRSKLSSKLRSSGSAMPWPRSSSRYVDDLCSVCIYVYVYVYVEHVYLCTYTYVRLSYRYALTCDTCPHQPTHTCLMRPQTASRKQEQAIEQAKKQWISNAMAAQLEQVC
jgi:hypothetical protein